MRALVFASLALTGSIAFCQTLRPYPQGEWRMKLGLPYVNSFYLRPTNETPKSQTGFVGLEGGVEYQLALRSFLALELSVNGAAEIPFGVLDIEGEFDRYLSWSLAASRNTTAGRFSFGYGVSMAANTWTYTRTFVADTIQPSRDLVTKTSRDLGLILNTYYRLGRTLHFGLIYRPYFVKFDTPDPWQYEHVITVDLMWRIRIGRKPPLK